MMKTRRKNATVLVCVILLLTPSTAPIQRPSLRTQFREASMDEDFRAYIRQQMLMEEPTVERRTAQMLEDKMKREHIPTFQIKMAEKYISFPDNEKRNTSTDSDEGAATMDTSTNSDEGATTMDTLTNSDVGPTTMDTLTNSDEGGTTIDTSTNSDEGATSTESALSVTTTESESMTGTGDNEGVETTTESTVNEVVTQSAISLLQDLTTTMFGLIQEDFSTVPSVNDHDRGYLLDEDIGEVIILDEPALVTTGASGNDTALEPGTEPNRQIGLSALLLVILNILAQGGDLQDVIDAINQFFDDLSTTITDFLNNIDFQAIIDFITENFPTILTALIALNILTPGLGLACVGDISNVTVDLSFVGDIIINSNVAAAGGLLTLRVQDETETVSVPRQLFRKLARQNTDLATLLFLAFAGIQFFQTGSSSYNKVFCQKITFGGANATGGAGGEGGGGGAGGSVNNTITLNNTSPITNNLTILNQNPIDMVIDVLAVNNGSQILTNRQTFAFVIPQVLFGIVAVGALVAIIRDKKNGDRDSGGVVIVKHVEHVYDSGGSSSGSSGGTRGEYHRKVLKIKNLNGNSGKRKRKDKKLKRRSGRRNSSNDGESQRSRKWKTFDWFKHQEEKKKPLQKRPQPRTEINLNSDNQLQSYNHGRRWHPRSHSEPAWNTTRTNEVFWQVTTTTRPETNYHGHQRPRNKGRMNLQSSDHIRLRNVNYEGSQQHRRILNRRWPIYS